MPEHTTDLERFKKFFDTFGIHYTITEHKNERTDLVLEDVNGGSAWAEFKFDTAEHFEHSGVYSKMDQDGEGVVLDRSDTEFCKDMKRKFQAVQRKERIKANGSKFGPPPILK